MAGPGLRTFMGRRQFRGNTPYGASAQELNAQFMSSMDDLISNLQEFFGFVENITPEVMIDALEPTLGKAMEYCPQDSGELRLSAYLEARTYYGRAEVEIGFGKGGRPSYAIYAHEMPFYHEPPTRSQFLRAAVDEDFYTIMNTVPALIRERCGT